MGFNWYGFFVVTISIFMMAFVGFVLCMVLEKVFKYIYNKTLRYTTFYTDAIVCDKQYKKAYTHHSTTKIGKVFLPRVVHYPASYKVYLRYKGSEYLIDNQALYNRVKVNDKVDVCVHEGKNRKQEVKYRYLTV